MRWIISTGKDIAVDDNQVRARSKYIERVTGAKVSAWNFIQVNGQTSRKFRCCTSDDEVDGTFITAHIGDVFKLCSLREVCGGKLVIANTCIWEKPSHKNLLLNMMRFNQEVELWFAKQELSMDSRRIFRQTTTLINVGQFGFQTSLSERELFRNRGRGLIEAIRESFVRVSPVILLGD